MHMRTLTMIAAGSLLLGGCGRNTDSVTLAGSTAFQPFAEKLAEEFMAKNPGANITVQGGGSAVGIQSALSGAAQIGMADLVELPAEAQALSRHVVARDGIAVVVNPANAVTNLTLIQIRAIFNGAVKNWNEVGGANAPITVVSREAGSGTRSSFEKIVQGIALTQDAIVQDSNGTIRETVAQDANAVGYLSHGLLNDKIKAVTVAGVACTTAAVVAGTYPLARPVFLLTKGPATGTSKAFIEYVLGAEGQKLIADNGLIAAK
ncbi:MAG: phosphate ABC transporter substrate-binding protein [bacterium]|nr:phosphate ABC transporter substrate-binding protein [bacterium]